MGKLALLIVILVQLLIPTACKRVEMRSGEQSSPASPSVGDIHELKVPASPSRGDKQEHSWQPAHFKGLIVGKSTSGDMLRVLGVPTRAFPPADRGRPGLDPEIWNDYQDIGEFPGTVTVIINKRKNLVEGIDLYPTKLTEAKAIEYFGGDYIITRYAHDRCLGDEESAPVYETPDGPIRSIEYRNRGIAIATDPSRNVDFISYVAGPIGTTSSRCKNVKSKS